MGVSNKNRVVMSWGTFTKTLPVPLVGFPAKPFDLMVVVVPNMGLKNEICGKNGEERSNCLVAGRGYNPAR